MQRLAVLALLASLAACGGDGPSGPTAYFELDGAIAEPSTFWNLPFPSDLRLDANGAPDMTGFPNPRNVPLLTSLLLDVPDRRGWPTMSTAYIRFTEAVPARAIEDVITDDAAILIDIDPSSPELGTRFPIVAQTLAVDGYVPDGLVALAPRPGIVLRAATRYAYVIEKSFAPGFSAPAGFADLVHDRTPSGSRGAAAAALYAPLGPALDAAGISRDDVLVATVFTTGDEIGRLRARSEAVRAAYQPTLANLALVGGDTLDGFCHLSATIDLPQFQVGTQPFPTDGRFVLDANDVPMAQGTMTIPVQITLPKQAMPASGWPLYQFFHGSGGLSTGLIDLGRSPDSGDHPEPGKGPGYVVALHGIAAASGAMPLNPERLPGASDYAYLNINNLVRVPVHVPAGGVRAAAATRRAARAPDPAERARGMPDPCAGRRRALLRSGQAGRGRPVDGRHVHEHDRRGRAALRRAGADRRRRVLEPDDPRDRDRAGRAQPARHRARRRRRPCSTSCTRRST